jgi:hypothetical protein
VRQQQFDLKTWRLHSLARQEIGAALDHFEHGHVGESSGKRAT